MPVRERGPARTFTSGDSVFFLDTNILVYAWGKPGDEKRDVARELVRQSMDGAGVVAPHILGEFASVLLHKIRPAVGTADVLNALDALRAIPVVPSGLEIVRRAVEAHREYQVHFYDGLMIATAEASGCDEIYSEDLNHGQAYFGVVVINPFR